MKVSRVWVLGVALSLIAGSAFAQGGGRGGRGFGGGDGGSMLGLLRIPEVQKELKLEATQIELLNQLATEARNQPRPSFEGFQNLTPEEREKRIAELRAAREKANAEQEKKIATILEPQQVTRVRQLQIQQAGIRALGRKEVADQLKLTPDQRQKIQAALDEERTAQRTAFQGFQGGQQPTDAQREEARKKLADARTAAEAKLNAVLTPAQKQQFESMKGAAFTFPERQRRPGGNNNGNA
jgi:hypothetical protein